MASWNGSLTRGLVTAAGISALLASPASAELPLPAELPLGRAGLPEVREVREVAPGLVHARIERGRTEPGDPWLLETGPFLEASEADALVASLEASGIDAQRERAAENADDGAPIFLVRSAWHESREAAEGAAAAFEAVAGRVAVRSLADTGAPAVDGPWRVNILTVDLATYAGEIDLRLAGGITPGAATVEAIAGDADAAVNGSFFVFRDDWGGTTGAPAGVFMIDGELAAESIDGRPALVLEGDRARVAINARTRIGVELDGRFLTIDGINRRPGRNINCGNRGDVQGEMAAHDFFCDDPDELVLFTHLHGVLSDAGEGAEIVVDGGRITAMQDARGAEIPADGFTLQATGEAAAALLKDAASNADVATSIAIEAEGGLLAYSSATSIVGGGPTLLVDGHRPAVARRAGEGWSRTFGAEDRLGFYYGWVLRRHPRTAAGVSEDGGTLYLVTVDGRQPGVSVGATITEMAELMRAIGADDALNLDGGGSTTMVIDGALANVPSGDEARPVSDAIVLTSDD